MILLVILVVWYVARQYVKAHTPPIPPMPRASLASPPLPPPPVLNDWDKWEREFMGTSA